MISNHILKRPSEQEINQMPEDLQQLWKNKILVHDFFSRVINDRDVAAADHYLTDSYIQHNPAVPTGREGFKTSFNQLLKNFTESKIYFVKILAEGDEVVTYSEYKFANGLLSLKMKTIDIWRIEDDRIAEHWDAVEGYGFGDRLLLGLQSQPNKANSWYHIN